tara:strand:+ start:132 stop:623 length:492 start_codon:yes stop_codon:yes gene_type:complete
MPGTIPYQGRMSDIVGSDPEISLQEALDARDLRAGAVFEFDPESDSYFYEIGDRLNEANPLNEYTKPDIWRGGEVRVNDANQSWVWHEDEQDYLKHSGTVTNKIELLGEELESKVRRKYGDDVYLVLKGRGHETYGLGEQGEKKRGYKIEKGPGGYYYSIPAN